METTAAAGQALPEPFQIMGVGLLAETLFALDQRNHHDCRNVFRGNANQEYYCGDFWVENSSKIDVRSERKAVGAMSIIRQRSDSNLFFRRSRQHIREDGLDLSVFWFVRQGQLSFSNQCGTKVAGPGDLMITRSMSPFLLECKIDGERRHEDLHVTVPTHLVRPHILHDLTDGIVISANDGELACAERILADLFSDDGSIGPSSAQLLVQTAINIVGNAIGLDESLKQTKQSLSDRRLDEILRFIEVHLSDPQLSTDMISRGCKISPRYLSFLLRQHGTSFSETVWEKRLTNARDWILASDPDDISISEIAYSVGFKSPAHFSRMFKRVYGVCPRDARLSCGDVNSEIDAPPHSDDAFGGLAIGSTLLQ